MEFQRKREEEAASRQQHSQQQRRREQRPNGQWLQQLNRTAVPLRPEEQRLSVELAALVRSCFSAFSVTDKNYLGLTSSALTQDGRDTQASCN